MAGKLKKIVKEWFRRLDDNETRLLGACCTSCSHLNRRPVDIQKTLKEKFDDSSPEKEKTSGLFRSR